MQLTPSSCNRALEASSRLLGTGSSVRAHIWHSCQNLRIQSLDDCNAVLGLQSGEAA